MKRVIPIATLLTVLLAACAPVNLNAAMPVYDTGVDPDAWAQIPAGEFYFGQYDEVESTAGYEIMVTDVTVGVRRLMEEQRPFHLTLTADGKQKISLGRGLVRSDVNVIMFDEPLTVIDPHLKWQLRSELKELQHRIRRTMIYVTHDQTEALTFADQVVVMNNGEVVQTGTPIELFEKPKHIFVGHFIGSPGMNVMPCQVRGGKAFVEGHAVAAILLQQRLELPLRRRKDRRRIFLHADTPPLHHTRFLGERRVGLQMRQRLPGPTGVKQGLAQRPEPYAGGVDVALDQIRQRQAFEDQRAAMARVTGVALRRSIECLVTHDTTELLADIRQPTLVLVGALDRETPPAYSKHLADHLPNALLRVIDEAGHPG